MTVRQPVYLDHHATTPLDPRVLERMLPALREHFGNPSSAGHAFGWAAAKLVEDARADVAGLIGADPDGMIFTAGATESVNLALKGFAARRREPGRLVITNIEHSCVGRTAAALGRSGWDIRIVECGPEGLIDPGDLAAVVIPGKTVVSLTAAQNEIGTIQPLREVAAICRERNVIFHVDAAQAVGKIPLDAVGDGIDMLSLSAHKIYGPKGVGALYVRRRLRRSLSPLLDGGDQEGGLRAGTINTAGVVGLGEACRLAAGEMADEALRLRSLRDRLLESISAELDGVRVNGSLASRLPGSLNLSFSGLGPGALATSLPGLAVSAGAACSSASGEVSPVLLALGLSREMAGSSLRLGIGRFNTVEEIDFAAEKIVEGVRELRRRRPGGR